MADSIEIKLFEDREIRSYWDETKEEWFFCVADVVSALTDSADVRQYVKKMRQRDPELNSVWGTICTPHQFVSTDGKRHNPNCTNTEGLFRIIQSIPSHKAEPFKRWLAAVGAERLRQMQDPERGIHMSLEDYKRLGHSNGWINQRLKSIEVRKDYTDALEAHNVTESRQFARLTDIMYKVWAGLTTREYKNFKGLHQENLRDNMTNSELVLNMLAEITATDITNTEHPTTMHEHAQVAARGGEVARTAREAFERQTGRSAISPMNAKQYFESINPHLEFDEESEKKD